MLDQDDDDREALISGFLHNPRVSGRPFYARLLPILIQYVVSPAVTTSPECAAASNVLLCGWLTIDDDTGERWLSSVRLRDVLSRTDNNVRTHTLWQVAKSPRVADKITFLTEVWPRQTVAKNPAVTRRLCEVALAGCGKSRLLARDLGYNPHCVTRCGGRPMRGWDLRSDALFSYVSCEARVPKDHPLRPILRIVDAALVALSPEFEELYAKFGRPSIPPERLLRALLLQAFYSVRSERQLMEQLEYNLLFRWFVGLSLDDEIWDETVFTKNRERLIEGDIANKFMAAVLNQEAVKALLSDDHFSVDGTLIEAWASMKSFRPKDGSGEPPAPGRNGERDFHGEKRSNETHASTTDPDARLYRKDLASRLSWPIWGMF